VRGEERRGEERREERRGEERKKNGWHFHLSVEDRGVEGG
jgi:hypothetical protein